MGKKSENRYIQLKNHSEFPFVGKTVTLARFIHTTDERQCSRNYDTTELSSFVTVIFYKQFKFKMKQIVINCHYNSLKLNVFVHHCSFKMTRIFQQNTAWYIVVLRVSRTCYMIQGLRFFYRWILVVWIHLRSLQVSCYSVYENKSYLKKTVQYECI